LQAIRWGIIGCGDVTEVKSGPGFRKARGSELVAVMRRNGKLAEDYAKRHGVPRWYDDADALIHDPQVDAVYVATPPGSHLEYALRVAAAGKPCYVEKPMARSHVECATMIEAFERARLPLFVAYYRRMLPRFLKAKELIDTGQLGQVTSCRYRFNRTPRADGPAAWRTNAELAGAGHALDTGSHVLDLLDYLLGEFVEFGGSATTSSTAPGSVEDRVVMHFLTERGVVGSAEWNYAASEDAELLEIQGTQGRLSTQVAGHSPLEFRRGEHVETFAIADPPHVQQPLIQSVVDELLGQAGACPSTGPTAARTSKVFDAVLSRFYGGRDDDFWLRPQTWLPVPSPGQRSPRTRGGWKG
jgi:1,5-anhydro-D-fructose reductase (1,5-anhydro-D-mannitol-forming)